MDYFQLQQQADSSIHKLQVPSVARVYVTDTTEKKKIVHDVYTEDILCAVQSIISISNRSATLIWVAIDRGIYSRKR